MQRSASDVLEEMNELELIIKGMQEMLRDLKRRYNKGDIDVWLEPTLETLSRSIERIRELRGLVK